MRRKTTTAVTMLVLLGIIGVGGAWGWNALTQPLPGIRASTTCQTVTVKVTLKTSQVQVSVYNAGNRSGLAGDTMKALKKRGFQVGAIGNSTQKVRSVLVRSSTRNSKAARLVALQFGPKVKPVYSQVDLGPGIDVVLGNKFQGLVPAPRQIKYKTQQQVCS